MTKKVALFMALGLLIGSCLTVAAYLLVPRLDLPRTHQLFQTLGIEKPQIIAFQPYWLLTKADEPYQKYFTNVTYFGLVVNNDGTIVKLVKPGEEEPGWTRLKSQALKDKLAEAKKQHLELSLLVHNSSNASISTLLTEPEKHARNLVADVAPLMREHGFTDLNIDIESFNNTDPEKRQRFTIFVQTIKNEMTLQNLGTVTIEMTPIGLVQEHLIDAEAVGKIVDRVVLMAYDFHYRDSFISGPVAPIGGVPDIREYDIRTTLTEATKKIPAKKILLGIPSYGYEWETLAREPGVPTIPGTGKTASHERVQELLKTCIHCTQATDPLSGQPYLILPATEEGYSQQIFYEDQESLQRKVELAQEFKLGGTAVWAVGYEGEKLYEPFHSYKKSFNWLK